MATVDEVMEAALRLSVEDRELLADKLYESLPDASEVLSERQLREELDRRIAAYHAGTEPTLTLEEARQELLRELADNA